MAECILGIMDRQHSPPGAPSSTTQQERKAPKRRAGDRAGLDLAQIIAAARSIEPAALSMQAVATALGVDRKALNHHVGGRDALLEMVALQTLESSVEFGGVEACDDWKEACFAYGVGYAEGMSALGLLATYVPAGHPSAARKFLRPTEALLSKLLLAGFSDEQAQRLLAMLASLCLTWARDVVEKRGGGEPRSRQLKEALSQVVRGTLPNLSRISLQSVSTYDRAQLNFTLEVLISGAGSLLLEGKR